MVKGYLGRALLVVSLVFVRLSILIIGEGEIQVEVSDRGYFLDDIDVCIVCVVAVLFTVGLYSCFAG